MQTFTSWRQAKRNLPKGGRPPRPNKKREEPSAGGQITKAQYNTILSCLHPDSRKAVSAQKLAAAFRLFDDPKIKALLVKASA